VDEEKSVATNLTASKLNDKMMAARHLHLIFAPFKTLPNGKKIPVVNNSIINESGKVIVLDRLLEHLYQQNRKVLYFKQYYFVGI